MQDPRAVRKDAEVVPPAHERLVDLAMAREPGRAWLSKSSVFVWLVWELACSPTGAAARGSARVNTAGKQRAHGFLRPHPRGAGWAGPPRSLAWLPVRIPAAALPFNGLIRLPVHS